MFTSGKILDESFLLVAMFFILASIIYLGFFTLRHDVASALVFSLISLYIWVAFPFKLMVAVNDPGVLWVSKMLFDTKMFEEEIASSFIVVFPALVFLLLGLFLFHLKSYKKTSYLITKINHTRFIAVIILLICLRVFCQLKLNIGMPGVIPTVLPIPYLSGFLALVTSAVLFAVVNLYFYYVIRLNDRKKILIPLIFLLINVVLGLRVGYKSELVIQGLLLIYYSFDAYRYLSKTNRKFMITVTASVVVIMVMVYPLVNHYRSAILYGADFSEAIKTAQRKSESENKSFSFAFIDRVNGISEFYGTTKLGEGRQFGFDAILNDSVMDLVKEELYGAAKDRAITSFGATYFSVFYLVGGGLLLAVSGFVAGWVIRWSLMFIRFNIFKSSFTFQAYLPIVCILWVKVLSAGGNILLPMKELFLVVVCLFLLERYGTTHK